VDNVDHNLTSILLALVLLVLGFLGFMGRGWIMHVNRNLETIWQSLKDERIGREERWQKQRDTCTAHAERLARMEAKLNGNGGMK
jgi:hypothetical protein